MCFHVVDADGDLVGALRREFTEFLEVEVSEGDILAVARGCIVLPCDDRGVLPEAITSRIFSYFGTRLQWDIRRAILQRAGGNLPVGEAIALTTGDNRLPELIVTATRSIPGHYHLNNVYHAMRAALGIIKQREMLCDSVFCSGLEGVRAGLSAQSVAGQIARAYAEWRSRAGSSIKHIAIPSAKE